MTNKERLELNNAKIEEITKTLAKKQVSPTDMLQQMVDQTNSCAYLFNNYPIENLDFIGALDTSKATNMYAMFQTCTKLKSVDVSKFDTTNVDDMGYMFYNCKSLTNLDMRNWDTSNVTSMNNMFRGCHQLTSLNIENFDTSKVTNTASMFYDCKVLTSLDLSGFNTSAVTDMANMFNGCASLTSLDVSSFNTSAVKNAGYAFYSCANLETIKMFDTSNMTTLTEILSGCKALKTVIGPINLINTSGNILSVLYNCNNLIDVTVLNIKRNFSLQHSSLLSNETLINTIQELWDLTGSTSQTLTLSTASKENIANIYVKLITPTQEQIDADPYINNKKPCVVCEPTDEGAMTLTEYATTQKNWAIA